MSSFVGDCISDVIHNQFELLRYKHIKLKSRSNQSDILSYPIKNRIESSNPISSISEGKVYDLFIDRLDDIWDYSTYGLIDCIQNCIQELYILYVLDDENVVDCGGMYDNILDEYIINFE